MFRFIAILFLVIILISLVRSVIGVLAKALSTTQPLDPRRENAVKPGGELKRDPVCGTYVSTSTSLKQKVGSETLHFCSTACREKYNSGN